MTEQQQLFETLIQENENATLGNLFGKPCGKINNKAFVAFFQDEMVFKIGRTAVKDLLQKYEGAQNWDPSGKKRPMKDWIQVPGDFKEDWKTLMEEAQAFMINPA